MGISQFLISYFTVSVSAFVVIGIPAVLVMSQANLPLPVILLAVMGAYSAIYYCIPFAIPSSLVVIIVMGIALLIRWRVPAQKRGISGRRNLGYWVAIVFCFALFIARWEPPGSDAVKWGSYARLIEQHEKLPGETRPLGPFENIGGINLGMPILISLIHFGELTPWERVISFTECLSLCLLLFSLILALENYLIPKYALWGGILSVMVATNPQQYLNWGGTPTLMGLCCGYLLIDLWRRSATLSPLSRGTYALAISFTAHAHPIGVYLSALVLMPVWLLMRPWEKENRLKLIGFMKCGVLALIFYLPFFRLWKFETSPAELAGVWEWQKTMAPYLFRESQSLAYNLYTQLGAYVWSTTFTILLGLTALMVLYDRHFKGLWPVILTLTVIAALLLNVLNWTLPLSFLVYPERVATMMVFPIGLVLGRVLENLQSKKVRRVVWIVFISLGLSQFYKRTYPILRQSLLTQNDLSFIAEIPKVVPEGECIKITFDSAGLWIPVLGFRCTIPYHVLSESVQDEMREWAKQPLHWEYIAGQGLRPI